SPASRAWFWARKDASWQPPAVAQCCVKIGCTSLESEGVAGEQVRLSLSASFFPSATAVTLSFATPGLMGVMPLLSFTGIAQPGVVHCPGVSVSMALWRAAPAATLRGATLTLVIVDTPHVPPTSKQACNGNVQTPSALPSRSQAVPSTHVLVAVVM